MESKVILSLIEYDELVAKAYSEVFIRVTGYGGQTEYICKNRNETFEALKEEIDSLKLSHSEEIKIIRKERDVAWSETVKIRETLSQFKSMTLWGFFLWKRRNK